MEVRQVEGGRWLSDQGLGDGVARIQCASLVSFVTTTIPRYRRDLVNLVVCFALHSALLKRLLLLLGLVYCCDLFVKRVFLCTTRQGFSTTDLMHTRNLARRLSLCSLKLMNGTRCHDTFEILASV